MTTKEYYLVVRLNKFCKGEELSRESYNNLSDEDDMLYYHTSNRKWYVDELLEERDYCHTRFAYHSDNKVCCPSCFNILKAQVIFKLRKIGLCQECVENVLHLFSKDDRIAYYKTARIQEILSLSHDLCKDCWNKCGDKSDNESTANDGNASDRDSNDSDRERRE